MNNKLNLLKKQFINGRIGGKGTIRRKIKRNPHIKKARLSKEQINFELLINKINKELINIPEEYKLKSYFYIEETFLEFFIKLRKKDISKKSKIIKSIDNIRKTFNTIMTLLFSKNFINIKDNKPESKNLSLNHTYDFIKKDFSIQGYNYIRTLYNILFDNLIKKTYIDTENKADNQDNKEDDYSLDFYLQRLNLHTNKEYTLTDVRMAFLNKSLEYHPDNKKNKKEVEKNEIQFIRLQKAYKKCKLLLKLT